MKRPSRAKVFSLFTVFSMALSIVHPAFALRQTGLEEQTGEEGGKARLAAALHTPDPSRFVRVQRRNEAIQLLDKSGLWTSEAEIDITYARLPMVAQYIEFTDSEGALWRIHLPQFPFPVEEMKWSDQHERDELPGKITPPDLLSILEEQEIPLIEKIEAPKAPTAGLEENGLKQDVAGLGESPLQITAETDLARIPYWERFGRLPVFDGEGKRLFTIAGIQGDQVAIERLNQDGAPYRAGEMPRSELNGLFVPNFLFGGSESAPYMSNLQSSSVRAAMLQASVWLEGDQSLRMGDSLVHPFSGDVIYQIESDEVDGKVRVFAFPGARMELPVSQLKPNYKVVRAGLEESSWIKQAVAMVDVHMVLPTAAGLLPPLKDTDPPRDVIDESPKLREFLEGKGISLSRGYQFPPAYFRSGEVPAQRVTVYLDPPQAEWAQDVQPKLEERKDADGQPLIQVVQDPSDAQIVVSEREIEVDLQRQVLLRVQPGDSQRAARLVTSALFAYLERAGLLQPGVVIYLYQGDPDKDVFLFA